MRSRSHKVAFRPRARLVSVLGEHLISDPAVGLIELVKNAYDADATQVVVEARQTRVPDAGSVVVRDNGCGMTLEDLTLKWLSPAVDHKEKEKQRGERTALGRLPIGEKGVGRFAVHHLGRDLQLVTRAKAQPEIALTINWDEFDESDGFLDGMTFEVTERDPEVFSGDETGTVLEIGRLRAPWNEPLLRKVHRTLRRLQSPLQEDRSSFRVGFVCPEAPELENIDSTDILERAHYEFRAVVQPDGECDFEYICRHPAVPGRSRSGTQSLLPLAGDDLASPQCGSFWVNLYVWDRSSSHLQASGVPRRELDAHSGVSLFRDGLRVLPYGEPGDDWLFLDQERIQAPADRIGNNQVIGLVLVDQSTNLQLRDKTNREGLIENQAFQDLRSLVRSAIRLFTTYWRSDRPSSTQSATPRRRGDLDAALAIAGAIGETARDDVPVRRPDAPSAPAASDAASSVTGETMTQREAVAELLSELGDVSEAIRDEAAQREILRQLAATGLAAERVVHEFGRQVAAALLHLDRLETTLRDDAAAREAAAAVAVCLRTLRDEFRVLAPYETAGRVDRKREISVRAAVDLAVLLNQHNLVSSGIDLGVVGDDFRVRSRQAALVQILDNLLHNACHWLSTRRSTDRRVIVALDPVRQRLAVADSGPGVHAEIVERVFEPFTTLKVEGTGLGLYISAELAESLGCLLRLGDPGDADMSPLTGATFVLDFQPDQEDGQ